MRVWWGDKNWLVRAYTYILRMPRTRQGASNATSDASTAEEPGTSDIAASPHWTLEALWVHLEGVEALHIRYPILSYSIHRDIQYIVYVKVQGSRFIKSPVRRRMVLPRDPSTERLADVFWRNQSMLRRVPLFDTSFPCLYIYIHIYIYIYIIW